MLIRILDFLGSLIGTESFFTRDAQRRREEDAERFVDEHLEAQVPIDDWGLWGVIKNCAVERVSDQEWREEYSLMFKELTPPSAHHLDGTEALMAAWTSKSVGSIITFLRVQPTSCWDKKQADEEVAKLVEQLGCGEEILKHRWNMGSTYKYDVWEDELFLTENIPYPYSMLRGNNAAAVHWIINHWGRWFVAREFEVPPRDN